MYAACNPNVLQAALREPFPDCYAWGRGARLPRLRGKALTLALTLTLAPALTLAQTRALTLTQTLALTYPAQPAPRPNGSGLLPSYHPCPGCART